MVTYCYYGWQSILVLIFPVLILNVTLCIIQYNVIRNVICGMNTETPHSEMFTVFIDVKTKITVI